MTHGGGVDTRRPRVSELILRGSGLVALAATALLVVHHDDALLTMHRQYSFIDLFGRLSNLAHLRRTGDIYLPFSHLAFTYPPGAILFFWPIQWVPGHHLALAWSVLTLSALAGSFTVVAAALFDASWARIVGVSCWAAAVAAMVFPEVTECLTYGQTATILLFFVVVDVFVARAPLKGILVGLATAVKVYPGVFILAWLWRRQWREALTAITTGVALTGVAAILFPSSAHRFVSDVMFGGQELHRLTALKNIKESSSVAAFFQRSPFHPHTLGSKEDLAVSLIVVVIALASSQRLHRAGLRLSAVVVLLLAGPIASPVAWDHYFAFLPLLVLVAWEAGPTSGLGLTALAATAVALVPWINFRAPRATTSWAHTYSTVAQNALLACAVAVIVAGLARRAPSARPIAGSVESSEHEPWPSDASRPDADRSV